MAKSKGTVFVAMKLFVIQRFGEDAWAELLNSLAEGDRATVMTAVSIGMYDLEVRVRALQALERLAHRKSIITDFGRFGADHDLNTVQKVFLRMASPAYVLEKSGELWRRFHDFGELKVERLGTTGARATLIKAPIQDDYFCLELFGYIWRLLELVGAKSVKCEMPKCRGRGDDSCEFIGTWC